jgi:hypothetical protein
MLSILGIKGYIINAGHRFGEDEDNKIDRDSLLIPETIGEDFDKDVARLRQAIRHLLLSIKPDPGCLVYRSHSGWEVRQSLYYCVFGNSSIIRAGETHMSTAVGRNGWIRRLSPWRYVSV